MGQRSEMTPDQCSLEARLGTLVEERGPHDLDGDENQDDREDEQDNALHTLMSPAVSDRNRLSEQDTAVLWASVRECP